MGPLDVLTGTRSISDRPYLLLTLMLVIPFLAVNAALYPLAQGVHGTTHASYGNEYRFNGTVDGVQYNGSDVPESGHFVGDMYVGDNTGWVFCNGKVRFSGTLRIRDADIDYRIRANLSAKTPDNSVRSAKDFQFITISGGEGEMEGGMPFWILGFLGSAVSALTWTVWYLFRKRTPHDRGFAIAAAVLGLVFTFNIMFLGPRFSPVCVVFGAVPILLMLFLTFMKPFREDLLMMKRDIRSSGIPEVMMLLGLVVMIVSTGMIVESGWGSFYGYTHDPGAAFWALSCGIAGLFTGAADIGFGFAKSQERSREPRREVKRTPPADRDPERENVFGLSEADLPDVLPPPGPGERGAGNGHDPEPSSGSGDRGPGVSPPSSSGREDRKPGSPPRRTPPGSSGRS